MHFGEMTVGLLSCHWSFIALHSVHLFVRNKGMLGSNAGYGLINNAEIKKFCPIFLLGVGGGGGGAEDTNTTKSGH